MKIALSIVALLLLVGCSEQKEAQETPTPTKEVVAVPAIITEVEAPATSTTEVETSTAMTTQENKEEPMREPNLVQLDASPVLPRPSDEFEGIMQKDGATLFKACASCHGADASKAALGKSQVIKGWSAQKIADALNGYKNKTYGGTSKAMMQGQVAKLSDEDIKVLAEHISKL